MSEAIIGRRAQAPGDVALGTEWVCTPVVLSSKPTRSARIRSISLPLKFASVPDVVAGRIFVSRNQKSSLFTFNSIQHATVDVVRTSLRHRVANLIYIDPTFITP